MTEDTLNFPPPGAALTGHDKHVLRGRAQTVKPSVTLGKDGVTETLLKEFDRALTLNGLVKIRSSESRDALKAQCRDLAEKTGAEFLGTLGRTAAFYRAKPAKSEFDE